MGAHVKSRFTTSTCLAPSSSLHLQGDDISYMLCLIVPQQEDLCFGCARIEWTSHAAGPLLQQQYRNEHMLQHIYVYKHQAPKPLNTKPQDSQPQRTPKPQIPEKECCLGFGAAAAEFGCVGWRPLLRPFGQPSRNFTRGP